MKPFFRPIALGLVACLLLQTVEAAGPSVPAPVNAGLSAEAFSSQALVAPSFVSRRTAPLAAAAITALATVLVRSDLLAAQGQPIFQADEIAAAWRVTLGVLGPAVVFASLMVWGAIRARKKGEKPGVNTAGPPSETPALSNTPAELPVEAAPLTAPKLREFPVPGKLPDDVDPAAMLANLRSAVGAVQPRSEKEAAEIELLRTAVHQISPVRWAGMIWSGRLFLDTYLFTESVSEEPFEPTLVTFRGLRDDLQDAQALGTIAETMDSQDVAMINKGPNEGRLQQQMLRSAWMELVSAFQDRQVPLRQLQEAAREFVPLWRTPGGIMRYFEINFGLEAGLHKSRGALTRRASLYRTLGQKIADLQGFPPHRVFLVPGNVRFLWLLAGIHQSEQPGFTTAKFPTVHGALVPIAIVNRSGAFPHSIAVRIYHAIRQARLGGAHLSFSASEFFQLMHRASRAMTEVLILLALRTVAPAEIDELVDQSVKALPGGAPIEWTLSEKLAQLAIQSSRQEPAEESRFFRLLNERMEQRLGHEPKDEWVAFWDGDFKPVIRAIGLPLAQAIANSLDRNYDSFCNSPAEARNLVYEVTEQMLLAAPPAEQMPKEWTERLVNFWSAVERVLIRLDPESDVPALGEHDVASIASVGRRYLDDELTKEQMQAELRDIVGGQSGGSVELRVTALPLLFLLGNPALSVATAVLILGFFIFGKNARLRSKSTHRGVLAHRLLFTVGSLFLFFSPLRGQTPTDTVRTLPARPERSVVHVRNGPVIETWTPVPPWEPAQLLSKLQRLIDGYKALFDDPKIPELRVFVKHLKTRIQLDRGNGVGHLMFVQYPATAGSRGNPSEPWLGLNLTPLFPLVNKALADDDSAYRSMAYTMAYTGLALSNEDGRWLSAFVDNEIARLGGSQNRTLTALKGIRESFRREGFALSVYPEKAFVPAMATYNFGLPVPGETGRVRTRFMLTLDAQIYVDLKKQILRDSRNLNAPARNALLMMLIKEGAGLEDMAQRPEAYRRIAALETQFAAIGIDPRDSAQVRQAAQTPAVLELAKQRLASVVWAEAIGYEAAAEFLTRLGWSPKKVDTLGVHYPLISPELLEMYQRGASALEFRKAVAQLRAYPEAAVVAAALSLSPDPHGWDFLLDPQMTGEAIPRRVSATKHSVDLRVTILPALFLLGIPAVSVATAVLLLGVFVGKKMGLRPPLTVLRRFRPRANLRAVHATLSAA